MQALLYPDLDVTMVVLKQAFHRAWFSLFITPVGDLSADSQCKTMYPSNPTADVCYAGRCKNSIAHAGESNPNEDRDDLTNESHSLEQLDEMIHR